MSDQTSPVALTVKGTAVARPTRREAMQWVLAAAAASALPIGRSARGAAARGAARAGSAQAVEVQAIEIGGYGRNPDLIKIYKPGDVWPLTFNAEQRKTVTALADAIIPKDDLGPAASEVGVVEMVDEWISAPYPQQQHDRPIVLDGLTWIDAEAKKRFKKSFAALTEQQMHTICDDICYQPKARPAFRKAARFFDKFRSLCAAAYYATPAGWQAIGYVGNIPLASFDGPPPEVLKRLDVTQTVI